ncbi:MAG: peroxiredoxin family protein [Bacteroidales bacterium]|nr:peroxiredoxin family protein [Bacteroidales bacterium]
MKKQIAKYLVILLLVFCANISKAQSHPFWDGIEDFDGPTDRNPLMERQIDYYFDSLVPPLPDSICTEIDWLLARDISTELRDFILWHLLERYQNPEYMTQDKVFIYLFDNYFSKLEIKDLKEENLAMIADKAERLRRLQINQIAPDFKGKDINGQPFDLHEIESRYVVLVFFDHGCSVCNEEIDGLKKSALPETTIVAVDTHPDSQVADANFINISAKDSESDLFELYDIESTPIIFVLDSQKRIIAKKIKANQINLFLQ